MPEPLTKNDSDKPNTDNVIIDSAGVPKMAPEGYRSPYDQDWRVLGGLAVTVLYLILMGLYIESEVGWSAFVKLQVERMGSFLEGAFAPLAFLWLVIGYFLQKKELRQNTEAMKMQFVEIQRSAEQATVQAEATARAEMHQRRESFLKLAELVRTQLGYVVALLYLSSQRADRNEEQVDPQRIAEMWNVAGEDSEAFSREMLRLSAVSTQQYCFKLFFGTEIRTKHTLNFEHSFGRLLRAAESLDEDDMIRDALLGTAHGTLFRRIAQIRENVPEGFEIGVYNFDPDTREGMPPTP
ncbi:MAG: hypothetical protein AAGI24_00460 [Pseudomonadota bacterium]